MYTFVVIVHLIVCLFLIFIILIQSSKGAEMGAAFGGSTQTLFGSRGAATFINKLTTTSAILFMLTSLSLAILSVNRGSVISGKTPVQQTAPQAPLTGTTPGPVTGQPAAGSDVPAPPQPPSQAK
ncbi:MAG: preprotein translocase subunit SecG [Nitrospirae bacterium]|nr:preprotein translocase subunit SecG [Nitrospirota bacterium]